VGGGKGRFGPPPNRRLSGKSTKVRPRPNDSACREGAGLADACLGSPRKVEQGILDHGASVRARVVAVEARVAVVDTAVEDQGFVGYVIRPHAAESPPYQ